MNDPISYGHFELEGWDPGLGASLSDWTTYYIGDTKRPKGHDFNQGKREAPWNTGHINSGESDDT